MFKVVQTALPGVVILKSPGVRDSRGSFFKIMHAPAFAELGLRSDFVEEYFSTSRRGVIRGMHFQTPPNGHAKVVCCLTGRITDVLLDLRRGSQTFGRIAQLELDGEEPSSVYIPEGVAHGFTVRSDEATLLYLVTSIHAPESDKGVLWSSFGFDWRVENPILSPRDSKHPMLADFDSPF